MFPIVYEVISKTMGGTSKRLEGEYNKAKELYDRWVEYFEELKADGEKVDKVILNEVKNGKVTLVAEHM